MPSSTQFPFPSGAAHENQVVEWLAGVLYPKEYRKGGYDRSKAKNRVRSRIRYARKLKKDPRLRRLGNNHVNVSRFFGWAVLQKDWEALIKIDGLRADTTVILGLNEPVPAIVANIGGVDADAVPDDLKELKTRNRADRQARRKAEADNRELKAKIKQLEDQLLSKAERSRLASGYGKEGGRGKKK